MAENALKLSHISRSFQLRPEVMLECCSKKTRTGKACTRRAYFRRACRAELEAVSMSNVTLNPACITETSIRYSVSSTVANLGKKEVGPESSGVQMTTLQPCQEQGAVWTSSDIGQPCQASQTSLSTTLFSYLKFPSLHRRLLLTLLSQVIANRMITCGDLGTAQAVEIFGQQQGLEGELKSGAQITTSALSSFLRGRPEDIKYPDWLAGGWKVKAEYVGFSLPLGTRFLTPTIAGARKATCLIAADVGASPEFELRFVSEPPVTDSVRADTAFNLRASVDAFLDFPAVSDVTYEGDHWALQYQLPRRAAKGRDSWRADLFLNERRIEQPSSGNFLFSQLFRQVTTGAGQTLISDYKVITSYHLVDGGLIEGRQRIAVFLQPQDASYFDTGGRAVAIYDYNLQMTRLIL